MGHCEGLLRRHAFGQKRTGCTQERRFVGSKFTPVFQAHVIAALPRGGADGDIHVSCWWSFGALIGTFEKTTAPPGLDQGCRDGGTM